MKSPLLQWLLFAAVAVPFAYFGAQIAAAPFFPSYSMLTTSASDLGSNRSLQPIILNVGAVLTGVLALLGSVGMGWALPRIGAARMPSWLLAACVASIGLAAAWAGLHPLPSLEHDPGALGAGMFAAPFVSALVVWQTKLLRRWRWLFTLNLAAFAACAWVLSGAAGVNLQQYGGLAQKLAAAVCFVPPAAIAFLATRLLRHADGRK
ncbi:MAG: DUF998 domain-containing protein [Betaproteobacteria bacterium]|nr:MAG: DUF998 domain-containing protein [Betaproteobacteria bacterium]